MFAAAAIAALAAARWPGSLAASSGADGDVSSQVIDRRLPASRSAMRTAIRVSHAPNGPSPRQLASDRYAVTNASWAASSAS